MPVPANLIHETSTTTGTGNLTVAAVNGKVRFSDSTYGFGTGGSDVFWYFISNQSAAEWEIGTGHMSGANTLVRDTILFSSNSNNAVNFSAGTKDVTNDIPAANQISTEGGKTLSGTLTLPNTGLHLLDTNASHDLIISPGSNLTADRTLTIVTGDADQTLTLPLGGWKTIESGSASNVANIDVDVSGYDLVKVYMYLRPVTDGVVGEILLSNDGSNFPASSGDYSWAMYGSNTSNGSDDSIQMPADTSVGNQPQEGLNIVAELYRFNGSGNLKTMHYRYGYERPDGATSKANAGSARLVDNDDPVVEMRFRFASGNATAVWDVIGMNLS